jgi:hypothetical protein
MLQSTTASVPQAMTLLGLGRPRFAFPQRLISRQ